MQKLLLKYVVQVITPNYKKKSPRDYHNRADGAFDNYFYRYTTSSKPDYDECVVSYTNPVPVARTGWKIMDHNKTDWAVYVDREHLWDAFPLTGLHTMQCHEFLGYSMVCPRNLRYRRLPCRCVTCNKHLFECVIPRGQCLSVTNGFLHTLSTITRG